MWQTCGCGHGNGLLFWQIMRGQCELNRVMKVNIPKSTRNIFLSIILIINNLSCQKRERRYFVMKMRKELFKK